VPSLQRDPSSSRGTQLSVIAPAASSSPAPGETGGQPPTHLPAATVGAATVAS
jgi:hypothetical protein